MDEFQMTSGAPESAPVPKPDWPRPSYRRLQWRALNLVCPRCGKGKLFSGWLRMNPACSSCHFRFERGPGYYLGSMYVNYGLTVWITVISFVIGRVGLNISGGKLLWPLSAFCVLFPLFFFRYARALWLALDCYLDSAVLNDQESESE